MTDQFQFEPQDEADDLDESDRGRAPTDRGLDDSLDEGYAPPERWSDPAGSDSADRDRREGETFEQRLDPDDPEVEDDWDEEHGVDTEGGGRSPRARPPR
jgi:hypothetical protein